MIARKEGEEENKNNTHRRVDPPNRILARRETGIVDRDNHSCDDGRRRGRAAAQRQVLVDHHRGGEPVCGQVRHSTPGAVEHVGPEFRGEVLEVPAHGAVLKRRAGEDVGETTSGAEARWGAFGVMDLYMEVRDMERKTEKGGVPAERTLLPGSTWVAPTAVTYGQVAGKLGRKLPSPTTVLPLAARQRFSALDATPLSPDA